MRNSTRVAGIALAAAAGIMAVASPAFAADIEHNHVYNGVSGGNENNLQVPVGACNNNVAGGVGAVVVPILSPQTAAHCSTAVLVQD